MPQGNDPNDPTITVIERPEEEGDYGSGPWQERRYTITGTDDFDDAMTELRSFAPGSIEFSGSTLVYLPRTGLRLKRVGPYEWLAEVMYGHSSATDTLEYYEDATSEQVHISFAPIVNYYNGAGDTSVPSGAINETPDGIDGLDVDSPIKDEVYVKRITLSAWTAAFQQLCDSLHGCVNSTYYHSHAPGSVRFIGKSVRYRNSTGIVEVEFRFKYRPNRTNITFGHGQYAITVPSICGWHYADVKCQQGTDSAGHIVNIPRRVDIFAPYLVGDLNALGV